MVRPTLLLRKSEELAQRTSNLPQGSRLVTRALIRQILYQNRRGQFIQLRRLSNRRCLQEPTDVSGVVSAGFRGQTLHLAEVVLVSLEEILVPQRMSFHARIISLGPPAGEEADVAIKPQ